MADFGGSDLEGFRAEAREWLAANFPKSLAGKGEKIMSDAQWGVPMTGDAETWRATMGAKGWGVPMWPKAYGGGGLSPAEARVLGQEMATIGAYSPIGGMGVAMFGPTLLEYGTEAQKQQHIPPIARGDIRWCQGFSEPGAGSDLASLSTKCEDKGDHYLINGSKIWTSGAQFSQWIFCLVRTDTTKKHEGISFLVFEMDLPGVEARPIPLINGDAPFCETFFTDVKVAKENLVGPLNGGWTIAKRLLQHERSNMDGGRRPGGKTVALGVSAKQYVEVDDQGRIADGDLRTRVAQNDMEARVIALTVARIAAEAKGNAGPSATTSIMKNAFMTMAQTRAELTIEIRGWRGQGWEGEEFTPDELGQVRAWLYGKAGSIYGGSQEVQSNITAKRILGLPDLNSSH